MRPSWCPWEKTALPVYSQHFLEKWMDHYCCTNAISICQKHQTSSYTELYLLHLNLLLYCLYQSISGEINLIFHCWHNCFYSVAKLVYVAIWCPFKCQLDEVQTLFDCIRLGNDKADQSLRHHTLSKPNCYSGGLKNCALSPAWDETSDYCGHIELLQQQRKRDIGKSKRSNTSLWVKSVESHFQVHLHLFFYWIWSP